MTYQGSDPKITNMLPRPITEAMQSTRMRRRASGEDAARSLAHLMLEVKETNYKRDGRDDLIRTADQDAEQ
jgi:hypothetical protein